MIAAGVGLRVPDEDVVINPFVRWLSGLCTDTAFGRRPAEGMSDREARAISRVANPGGRLATAGPSRASRRVAVLGCDSVALGGAGLAALGEDVVSGEGELRDELAGLFDGVGEFSLARFSDLRFEGGALGEEVLVAGGLGHGGPGEGGGLGRGLLKMIALMVGRR